MGQDYRLKKLYEQIYSEKKSEVSSAPKNLQEAYKHVLVERTAFYAKELPETQEKQPDVDGLVSLGTVSKAEKIKYLISSQSAKPLVNDLMLAAGNWTNVDNYQEDLLGPIATEFFAAGLGKTEIESLIKNKNALTTFSQKVAEEQFFNTMSDAVVPNLKSIIQGVDEQKLNDLYKYCFTKKCKINDIAVGFGEIALSLFTDCKKGVVGDLDSATAGAIEVKTDGGRIAKKTQVNTNYKDSLMEFLTKQKAKQKVSQTISTLKHDVEEQIDQIRKDDKFLKVFTNNYEKFIADLIASIGTPAFSAKYTKSPFQERNVETKSSNVIDRFYQNYQQRGLISTPDEHSSPTPESIKEYAYNTHRAVSQIFRKDKLQKKYEATLSVSQATTDLAKLSVWDSIRYFFFTDFGFTAEQLAEGLLLLVNPKARFKAEQFLPEIQEILNSPYAKSLKAGNISVLKGLIFALQVGVYASELFDYLFVVSTTRFEGIGFRTNSFKHLFEKFYENRARITLDIDLDPDRGGSAITVK